TEMAAVPRCVIASAIAEPQEGEGKIVRILEAQHHVAGIRPDRRRPTERCSWRFGQHREVLMSFGNRIAMEIYSAAIGKRQLRKIGKPDGLGEERPAT